MGLTHVRLAAALGVSERSSYYFPAHGAPRYIELALKRLRDERDAETT